MNTITDPRETLTTGNADKVAPRRSGRDTVTRSWEWQLGPDAFALMVHSTPVYRSQGRPTYTASLVVWGPIEQDDPIVELYSPAVSSQARALEWLSVAVRDAKRPA
jgi:hypothetical protein